MAETPAFQRGLLMPDHVRVAVNGYGVIGKRVADAVRAQPDMHCVGISDITSDYRVKTAVVLGLPVYASAPETAAEMQGAGIPVAGVLDDLLKRVDVVVDCTPKGVGAGNLARYRAAGVKTILQGGETHDVTGHSFVAQANYESALGRDATRVVSCNTTSTVRTLGALKKAGLRQGSRRADSTRHRSVGGRSQRHHEHHRSGIAHSKPSRT